VPAALILVYLASIELARRIPGKGSLGSTVGVCAVVLLLVMIGHVVDPENARAYEERWEWEGAAIGELFATGFGAQHPLLAVDPAGCVPYFSHLPACIDMLGINDHYLAHHRPRDLGEGFIGHELGSGAYVLSRKPDLVLFNRPAGSLLPGYRSGLEIMTDSTLNFRSTFRPITFECDRPVHVSSIVFVRTEGGSVGIRRSADRIWIPGYLFSANPLSRVRADDEGRLGVDVSPNSPAGFTKLSIPPGTWSARAESSGGIILRVWRTEGLAPGSNGDNATMNMLAAGTGRATFVVPGGASGEIAVTLHTDDVDGARVREVVLERVGGGTR
jgi:hypothetical protein